MSAEAAQAASACVPLLDSQSKLASSSSIRKKIVYDEAPADGEHALDTIPKALQDLLKELIENNVLLKGAKLVRLQVNCKAHFHFVHVDPRAWGQRNSSLRQGNFRFVTVVVSLGTTAVFTWGGLACLVKHRAALYWYEDNQKAHAVLGLASSDDTPKESLRRDSLAFLLAIPI